MGMIKRATMNEVARRAGVSISSVSRVANNYPGVHPEIRSRIEKAMRELSYHPNVTKGRSSQAGNRLVCFLLANRDLHIPFHSRALQAIEKECSRRGDLLLFRTISYTPQTQPQDLDLRKLLQPFSDTRLPHGLILTGQTYPNLLEALGNAHVPVVLLGNNYAGADLSTDAVSFDGFQGAYDATRHLIDLGHRQILYIGNPNLTWFSSLCEGYLAAIKEAGLKPISQTKGLSDSFYSNGYLSVEMMFEHIKEITAIFAGYDDTALGAWKALNDRNLRVPQDVSLVGFNDEDYAEFTVPPLTTVRIDVEAIGRELIHQLYRKLENPSQEWPLVKLGTTLVKRGTCWQPRYPESS